MALIYGMQTSLGFLNFQNHEYWTLPKRVMGNKLFQ